MITIDPEFAKAACGCSFTKWGFVLDHCPEATKLKAIASVPPYGFPHLAHYATARISVGLPEKPNWEKK